MSTIKVISVEYPIEAGPEAGRLCDALKYAYGKGKVENLVHFEVKNPSPTDLPDEKTEAFLPPHQRCSRGRLRQELQYHRLHFEELLHPALRWQAFHRLLQLRFSAPRNHQDRNVLIVASAPSGAFTPFRACPA